MSLAAQLKNINQAHRTLAGGRLNSTDRPSFLFNDQTEAGDLDIETVFAIGKSGMAELDIIDPELSRHYNGDYFFSQAAMNLDPALMDQKELSALIAKATVFLRRLGLHFENPACHKALEWMIRRFRVNELMIDAVIECIILYHETEAFVRMVQILFFKPNDRWGFIFDKVKLGGKAIDRSFIVSRSLVDESVLEAIFNLTIWHGENAPSNANRSSFEKFLAFWSMVSLEHITRLPAGSIAIEKVSKFFPMIAHLMKTGRKEASLHISGLMLGTQLSQKAILTHAAMEELIEFAARTCPSENTNELLAFLSALVEMNILIEPMLGERAFNHIVKLPNLASSLASHLNGNFDIPKILLDRLISLLENSTNPHADDILKAYRGQKTFA